MSMMGEELYSVCSANTIGGGNVALYTMVVLQCWSNVPAFDSMWAPSTSLGWFLVDNDFCARRCLWCFVKIKGAF